MKNKIMLDDIRCKLTKERITKVLDRMPFAVVDDSQPEVFPSLRVQRRGNLHRVYDLVVQAPGQFKFKPLESPPAEVDGFYDDYLSYRLVEPKDPNVRSYTCHYGFFITSRQEPSRH